MRRKTTKLDITSDKTLYRSTDFAPARKALATETVLFTGGAAFDEDGVPYRTFPEGSVQYVGPPTAEIDSAWEYLLSGRYFIITEQEAKEAFGSRYKDYYVEKDFYTGYMVGLDLFHVLHCTNMLRKLLDPEYYFPQGTNREWERYHVGMSCTNRSVFKIRPIAFVRPK
ncbi:hypothetical protein CB0940_07019 [Cercospora beticola]|uniref:Uncharacterized protein n=1 Tax=Cercospora beticola TaxID=122368 RepID=A0A2G5H7G6_CERBT|nr:hypothetical protein CB0940_07019 [Cercospora beticola]PIA88479.1 hypothetical protein CB0940_07019 [Cercospora beticola]WPB02941.1 hypothetical protein RHO25_007577 [Cercospora beticola]